jgi:hypothetical protein
LQKLFCLTLNEGIASMEKVKKQTGDNKQEDFQGFVLDDSPKTVEEQLAIIRRYLERSAQEREKE